VRRHALQTKFLVKSNQDSKCLGVVRLTVASLNSIYQSNGWICSFYRFEFEASIESLLTLPSSSFQYFEQV
jgi:hypothetical protein